MFYRKKSKIVPYSLKCWMYIGEAFFFLGGGAARGACYGPFLACYEPAANLSTQLLE